MAIGTAAVTFEIADQLGNDFDPRRTKVWITTNIPGDTVIDKAGNKIRLGSGNVTLNADGTGSMLVWVPGADANPSSWQTTVHVDYPDRNAPKGRTTKSFGPFTITTNADLADLVAEMPVQPEYLATVLETVQDMIDEATGSTGPALANLSAKISGHADHGNVSGAVTFNGPTASHRFDATAATTVTLAGYSEGDVATLICFSGAEDVTVANAGDVELVDATAWSAEYARGTWVSGGGGGTPAVPDSTPPSAVTGLSATGGEGQVTFNWTAATDAESTVGYKYRVWPTSGGATGEYVTRSSVGPVTVTGLAAGGYTVQVYAYSSGGASATASATATVTSIPGWSTIITDDFTAADATLVNGRTTTTGGRTWTPLGSEDSLSIKSNKATQGAAAYNPYSELYLAAPLSSLALEVDYLAAQQLDSSLPNLGIRLANMPGVRIESDGGSGWRLLVVGYNSSNSFGTIAGPEAIPASGTLRVQRIGANLTISVDDDEVIAFDPTGYSGYGAASDYVQLSLSSGKTSTFDNFKVEVYS